MIKEILILICFIVLAFPLYTRAQTVDQITREAKEVSDCLIKNAMMLDDGISDAVTIAKALTFECRKEFQKINTSNGALKYMKPEDRQRFIETSNIENLNLAISTVLKIRSRINKKVKIKPQ